MTSSLISAVFLTAALAGAGTEKAFVPTFESHAALTPQGKIDELVFGKLKQLGIQPANLCSDSVFVRRAYLDVIGTLPTGKEAVDFLADKDPNKRSVLIDKLLARDEFAEYWAVKWADLLRIKAEFPINLWPNAAQAYHHWVEASLRENKPYDKFVRELLTESGSNFRVPPVNFYRAMQNRTPEGIAQAVALTLMGTRTDKWPKEQLAGLAAFFFKVGSKETGEWKEEIIFFDPSKALPKPGEAAAKPASEPPAEGAAKPAPPPTSLEPVAAVFPDGTKVQLNLDRDPREIFADWFIRPENPWFTRNITNRMWSWLVGRGIIHEPDDIRPDNPPANPELLAYLQQELVSSHYDLKHLYRLILNSKTYQLSSIPRTDNPAGAANFAYYPLRRLDAEVLADALCQITGTTEEYSSAIPEPFTFINQGQRSISLPDGSISSSFLELFGRPSRDSGLESERANRPSPDQRLHFLNSSHVQNKLDTGPKFQGVLKSIENPHDLATWIYVMILSRYPTDEEMKIAEGYASKGRDGAVDLAWALINTSEFLYRH